MYERKNRVEEHPNSNMEIRLKKRHIESVLSEEKSKPLSLGNNNQ